MASCFPALAGRRVVPLDEGWDNAVLLVGDRWTVRLARRAVALPGIRREVAVLPVVSSLLPLDVPVPELVGDDRDPVDPWPMTGARLLRGVELADADLAEDARVEIAASVGGFLRVLHSSAVREAAIGTGFDLPTDPMDRGWPRARLDRTREVLAFLVDRSVWAGNPGTDALLDTAAELGRSTVDPVLVHGDLHVRHVLVDDREVAGIIDWGDLCLADPAVDLALAFAAFDGVARASALAAYGPVGAETELRARALAVRLSALLADYALRDDRPRLLAEALRGLARAVA